jgi:hypothetical protein
MPVSVADPVGLDKRRRQTAAARAVFHGSFPNDEARSAHMRAIGLRGQAGRIGLRPEDAAAVLAAYQALGRIVATYRLAERDLSPAAPTPEVTVDGTP